jgi:flagellar hook protein FlgE
MASTTAMYIGLSGLLGNSRMLDVVGNNIANTNSPGFKSNRISMAPTFSRTFSLGTAPTSPHAGSNPGQFGLGVSVIGTQRDFNNGSLSTTGVSTDLAIEGDGFFVVEQDNERYYTRSGNFIRNSLNELTTPNGGRVQGYAIDNDFEVVTGQLVDIVIPVGSMTIAERTENVQFAGNLNATGDLATTGALYNFGAMQALAAAAPPPANPPFADETTRLVDIDDGTGAAQFLEGHTIRLSDAEKAGKTLADADMVVDTDTTVADFMTFLEEGLGIVTSLTGEPGGVSIDPTTGVVTVAGNLGTNNDLLIDSSDLVQLDDTGASLGSPFTLTKTAEADGESVRTTYVVYDSLGAALEIDMTAVLVGKDSTGTTWRYFSESPDSAGVDLRLGSGTVSFDTTGQLVTPLQSTIEIDRSETGADSPLTISLEFAGTSGGVTALGGDDSALAAVFQDGSPIGTLDEFSVGEDGVVSGSFTNGLVRTLGQVAIATFTNAEGLVDVGDMLFQSGPASGTPVITTPANFGAGRVLDSTLELSNVDLSQEFINLILAQTGYSASSRVISTANQLFQQLLVLGR